ncbi:MAG: carboxypeptidase-like regulatory domain-containing protein [Cytophagales bacterium]|nr:carboxypeptidase-like regulatory domain-containing protein [Cytophagales bacterium]
MNRYIFFMFILTVLLAGVRQQAKAQASPVAGLVQVQGFTLRKDSLTPAPYVTVTNLRSRFGTISADNGYFTLQAQRGDTLEFSAVNLQPAVFVVPAYYPSARLAIRAVLTTRTYQLDEVVVRPYTEKQFKKDLLALQLPDDEPDLQLPAIPRLATPSAVAQSGLGVGVTIGGPLTALYDRFSREAKSRRRLAAIMAADQRKKMYNAKLNRDFVARVTGLAGTELEDFIQHCKLDENFVIEANEYEVAVALRQCLQDFRKGRN